MCPDLMTTAGIEKNYYTMIDFEAEYSLLTAETYASTYGDMEQKETNRVGATLKKHSGWQQSRQR